ncbi:uncharacterized protein BX664DRAFT_343220 [Halteromyces radiatus]|uniref:uncharacterized protein n=1 Tax=Halteromyces radiatus TaxID=101107 RepID=UPI00221EDBF2|nr:uncharacterized protein BX664DRAFT_343220 [Halteromyces radiatus]KAI8077683.1 hypothetical protein BX664DRAFT_343220 [Halteromyces radiatus]
MSQSPPLPPDLTLKRKRKKVSLACVFCRRSHMTCDEGRPCQRCIKRNIGNMCHDEPRSNHGRKKSSKPTSPSSHTQQKQRKLQQNGLNENNDDEEEDDDDMYDDANPLKSNNNKNMATPLPTPPNHQLEDIDDSIPFNENIWDTPSFTFASESMGNELNVLNDFLDDVSKGSEHYNNNNNDVSTNNDNKVSTKENFFLTAADPKDGKLEDRLNEVINAKYEAGFLKPYNYVNGYARLQRYMDQYMSPDSRQRILNVMGTFRPTFRDVAQSLTDVDLILVEEAFERLLLDYDRVFSAMAIPACLWRRTGEIYKGNKEFATLIDVSVDELRDGRMCIYEIMAEESTVNYWEKYGNIAFDPRQKAVLTSCLIRHQKTQTIMSCCFSFTVRRDKYNMTIIVGNFLPIDIQN